MRIALGLLLLPLVGCVVGTDPCQEAAARLTTCSDDQKQAFVAACQESGDVADPEAFAAEDSDAACKAPPSSIAFGGSAKDSAAEGACVAAMYAVKWTVTALSPAGQPLSAQTKATLRPLYGSLVDDVRITIGATLPPRIVIAGHELSVPPDAMTFGDHIFMLQEVADDTRIFDRLLLTTTHELTHVKQARNAGGFYGFAVNYCRAMIAANYDYNQISLELEAYGVQNTTRHNLQTCGAVTCP